MLRIILLVVGIIIILGIAFDGWRRKHRRIKKTAIKDIEPEVVLKDSLQSRAMELKKQTLLNNQPVNVEASSQLSNEPIKIEPEIDSEPVSLEIEEVKAAESANQELPSVKSTSISSANEEVPVEENTIVDNVVSLTVMATHSCRFAGYDLINALQDNHLHHGDYDIYHRHKYKNGKGPLYFSVASVVDPGTLNPKDLANISTPGVVLFLPTNTPKHDRIVFKHALATAHNLAKTLGGIVCNEKRIPLTEQSMKDYESLLNL